MMMLMSRLSLFAKVNDGRCSSATIVLMVFPSKQFHISEDTSTMTLIYSVNVSGKVWSDSNLQPFFFGMVITVPVPVKFLFAFE